MIKCIQLVGTLVFIAHWLGCFWFYVGYAEEGWVQVLGLIDENLVPTTPDNDGMEWVTCDLCKKSAHPPRSESFDVNPTKMTMPLNAVNIVAGASIGP
jgi:hypothetical protein